MKLIVFNLRGFILLMKLQDYPIRRRLLSVVALLLLASAAARAGTVSGVVHNGTNNNKIAPGVDVLLIQLQGGMSVVASTKTDADGRFHFDNPGIGQGPMLIRAVYRGVFFHQPLTPGTSNVDVTVYEPTTNPAAIQVPLRLLVFQPNGDKLMVGEEYSVQNNSSPPAAYFKQDGNFEFTIPQGAEIDQVSTFGPSGMPVRQGTIDKGKGRYAISYAFQPGQNGVRISYIVPYTGNQAQIRESSTYDAQRVLLVIPPTMQVASTGFNAAGTEQGYNVFSKESLKAGTGFDVSVSGTAPPPAEASASSSPDQVNGRDSSPETTIETAPARIGDEKWILLGGLAAIFAVGVGLLLRKPIPDVASAPAPPPAPKGRKAQRAAQAAQAKAAATAPAPPPVERVTQEVNSSLDSLKDTLLRLELRRQAGTITDADYALERGRAEQLLRDLVQG
ncbi:MAG TPA: carboxypeptidase-like regulatory domain-containing protein [Verrucomicrobiae bacterium]|nr:carboxypeptidase-like regulatory domain-containing protein [Verrucomicrobiae bacterium]